MEVSWILGVEGQPPLVTDERVSTGVERLDAMLDGGFHRGAGILVTGSPGTAKTTLAGAFAEAACLRGERTLYVTFDSHHDEVVRNLRSVGIRLDRHLTRAAVRGRSASCSPAPSRGAPRLTCSRFRLRHDGMERAA